MPPRNVVPKPVQKPHPPLWVACSNRDDHPPGRPARHRRAHLRLRRPGRGEALGRRLLRDLQERVRADRPRGQPEHRDGDRLHPATRTPGGAPARARRLPLLRFALGHYYVFGTHVPGRTEHLGQLRSGARQLDPTSWAAAPAASAPPTSCAPPSATFEEIGVDQTIFIQQGGNNRHEHICESLELFAGRVMPEFKARHEARAAAQGRGARAVHRARDARASRRSSTRRRSSRSSPTRCSCPASASTSRSFRSAAAWGRPSIRSSVRLGTRRLTDPPSPGTSRPRSRPRCGAGFCLTFRVADR